MHGYDLNKPLSRPGITLVELAVGIALASVVALVSAGLFKAGIKSYNYAYRQTRALTSARKAMAGDGSRFGMVWAAQAAASIDSLAVSSLAVTPAGDFSTVFFTSNNKFYTSRLGTQTLQADSISSMTVNYYNMDQNGLIMVATAPAAATFVTAQITMKGALGNDKTYNFMSGAQLRNKQ